MKKPSWAIRITLPSGRAIFRRRDGEGLGPIMTFFDKAAAETEAARLRENHGAGVTVTVIQRSHGRNTEKSA